MSLPKGAAQALREAAADIRALAEGVPTHGVTSVEYEDGRFVAYEHAVEVLLDLADQEDA